MWKILFLVACAVLSGVNSSKLMENNPCDEWNMETHFVNDFACCPCYFTCFRGDPFPLRCPDGFYFCSECEACLPLEDVECERCPDGEGVHTFPIDGSCMDYTLCINGQSLERQCAPGTRFHPTRLECVQRELVECEADVRCPPTGTELIHDPNSCLHFIICSDGMQLDRRQCAQGLVFDKETNRCIIEPPDFVCQLSATPSARRSLPWPIPVPRAPVKMSK